MEVLLKFFGFITLHWSELLLALVALLNALIAVFLIIPGPQPEATLQKIVDFLGRFSRK